VAVLAGCSIAIIAPEIGSIVGLVLIVLPILAMMGKIRNSAVRLLTPAKTLAPRIGEMCFGIVLLLASMGVSSWKQQRERTAVAKAQQEALQEGAKEARRHHEAEISKLRQDLGPALVRCQGRLDSAKTELSATNYAQAEEHVRQASTCISSFLILSPWPPELASFRAVIDGLSAQITPITEAKGAWDAAQSLIEESEESRREREFMAAENALTIARKQLTSIEDAAAKTLNYDLSQALRRVDAKLKLVKRPAERQGAALKKEQDSLEKKRTEEAIWKAACGDPPKRSPWDGEIYGLKSALKETAHDPHSIEVSDCSEPVLSEKSCWVFHCKVRGKNAFGALILRTPVYSKSELGFQEIE
jgi:hypothetical protein